MHNNCTVISFQAECGSSKIESVSGNKIIQNIIEKSELKLFCTIPFYIYNFLTRYRKMKKSLAVAALLSLFVAACGGESKPAEQPAQAAASAASAVVAETASATEAAASMAEAAASMVEAAASEAASAAK
ncbi:hypothetical protein [Kingella negevensis]|uniref:hypothetical protein n=1 Tax=Kingella negevensis TaxID=1522312 RepID=UPI003D6F06EA